MKKSNSDNPPAPEIYAAALRSIPLTDSQMIMMEYHLNAENQTTTASNLANAAGFNGRRGTNLWYGNLGKLIGNAVGFDFDHYERQPETPIYVSSICYDVAPDSDGHLPLAMRPEFAEALRQLGWFSGNSRPRRGPSVEDYRKALEARSTTENEMAMLRHHYLAPDHTTTATQLAEAAGFKNHGGTNLQYGKLAKQIGQAIGFTFDVYESNPETPLYISSLCIETESTTGQEILLVMRPEVVEALRLLGWFNAHD